MPIVVVVIALGVIAALGTLINEQVIRTVKPDSSVASKAQRKPRK